MANLNFLKFINTIATVRRLGFLKFEILRLTWSILNMRNLANFRGNRSSYR